MKPDGAERIATDKALYTTTWLAQHSPNDTGEIPSATKSVLHLLCQQSRAHVLDSVHSQGGALTCRWLPLPVNFPAHPDCCLVGSVQQGQTMHVIYDVAGVSVAGLLHLVDKGATMEPTDKPCLRAHATLQEAPPGACAHGQQGWRTAPGLATMARSQSISWSPGTTRVACAHDGAQNYFSIGDPRQIMVPHSPPSLTACRFKQ